MDSIFLFVNNEEKEFRQFKENPSYYVSADGDVYSTFSKKLLKHYIDLDGYHRIDIYLNHKQKHVKIHKLVYLVWVGDIPKGYQLNHIDDNKDNNNYKNLYLGSQMENIHDCFRNNHRVGNRFSYTLNDKKIDLVIKFPSIKELREYCGIKNSQINIRRLLKSQQFASRFDFISKESVTTIEQYDQLKKEYQEFLKDHNLVEYN